jgi:hypothetical protein
VWLAGDSGHQVIPTGGYGINTGVVDAVDLGWKFAQIFKGWGGSHFLASYKAERYAVGVPKRAASARHSAMRSAIPTSATSAIHEHTPEGEQARRKPGERILKLGNLEIEALGIEIGYRYDDSPVVCQRARPAPSYEVERYTPTTWHVAWRGNEAPEDRAGFMGRVRGAQQPLCERIVQMLEQAPRVHLSRKGVGGRRKQA